MSPLADRPSHKSQCGRILRLLERHPGQWIRISEIHAVCGPMRLNSRMSELRKVWGFSIECKQNGARSAYRLVTLGRDGASSRTGEAASLVHNTAAEALPSLPSVDEQLRIVA